MTRGAVGFPAVRRVLDPGATMRPAPSPGNTPDNTPSRTSPSRSVRVGRLAGDAGGLSASLDAGSLPSFARGLRWQTGRRCGGKARALAAQWKRHLRGMSWVSMGHDDAGRHPAGTRTTHRRNACAMQPRWPPSPGSPARGPELVSVRLYAGTWLGSRGGHRACAEEARASEAEMRGRRVRRGLTKMRREIAVRATPALWPWRSCPSVHALGVMGRWWWE